MKEIFTNLPTKDKDNFAKTIQSLTDRQYSENFQFNQNDYDAAVGFFVKRGFDRQPAEETAYVVLQQAKIDGVSSQSILDLLGKANPATLSELISVILNANRYKSSRLGVRNTKNISDFTSRNILA